MGRDLDKRPSWGLEGPNVTQDPGLHSYTEKSKASNENAKGVGEELEEKIKRKKIKSEKILVSSYKWRHVSGRYTGSYRTGGNNAGPVPSAKTPQWILLCTTLLKSEPYGLLGL